MMGSKVIYQGVTIETRYCVDYDWFLARWKLPDQCWGVAYAVYEEDAIRAAKKNIEDRKIH